jgi:dolichyl-phosphate-mannose--protein O-mannosyl transferase
MLGAAMASKWNGALLLLAALVITVAWEIAARRSSGQETEIAVARTMTRESASILLLLIVVPLLVYGLTYVGRIGNLDLETYCDTYAPGPHCAAVQHESSVRKIVDLQVYMANFHRSLETPHSYESPPWSWLLLKRPVSYYFCPGGEACPSHLDGRYAETMTFGSPFAWWSSLIALIFVVVTLAYSWIDAAKGRGEPAWLKPEGFIFGGFAFAYLPWLFLANNRPAQFIFYALPAVPFMCLALAYVVVNLGRSWQARTAMAVFGAMTVAMFAFYYPITSALPISSAAWQQRIWIFHDCDVTKTHPTTTVVTSTSAGATITQTETSQTTASEPPDGWCWI